MELKVLYDQDIHEFLTYRGAIGVMDDLLRSKLKDNVVHPPRFTFPTQNGSMTFTMGELLEERVAGFRLYAAPKTTQLTLTMDTHTGEFKGLIVGKLIGVVRTASLNAVAIKYMSRDNSRTLGVIGSGFQARHHALAALEVREIDRLIVYSREPANCEAFLRFVEARWTGRRIRFEMVGSTTAVAEQSDILICATSSGDPVLKADVIRPGTHINNVGPKYQGRHELPVELYQRAGVLATDSIPQMFDQNRMGPICFDGMVASEKVRPLESFMNGFQRDPETISLFCSMGLAGSEVALANWVLEGLSRPLQ